MFAIVLLTVTVLPGLSSTAGADRRGTIVSHARYCHPGADDGNIVEECHDNRVIAADFKDDNRRSKPTALNGNVSFKRVVAGDHLITLTDAVEAGRSTSYKASCSNVLAGTGHDEAVVRMSESPDFYVRLGAGDRLVCVVTTRSGPASPRVRLAPPWPAR